MLRSDPNAAYEELVERSQRRSLLMSCLELLSWDELTYMPRGGVENRGRQTAYLVGLLHDSWNDPRFAELLARVEQSELVADPDSPAAVNLRQWRRLHDKTVRVPRALLEETARVATTSQQRWAEARQDSNFAAFLPWLEQIVRLKREEAQCFPDAASPYDALLDDFEPGCTQASLTTLFAGIRQPLQELLQRIAGSRQPITATVLRREYPLERQRIFGESVAADIGFDFECGRLDGTTHPFFSWVGPGDCRITTRYNPNDFAESFFAVLHELGHGLYEQGLDPTHHGTPLGESSSLGIHESQSRIWENAVGRSRPFWRHFFPRVRELFHQAVHDVGPVEFYQACNQVEPGWNRVRADEVSYDLHILVRFELETALIEGDLSPGDLPAAWNEKYAQYLGVIPRDDREGCLQDGHWSAGQFGYFPTYTLGNIYAAQLMARALQDLPDLPDRFARGDFGVFRDWLRERIYRHGQRYSASELIQQATGSLPSSRFLLESLTKKYGELYALA